ncbi:MAG: arginase family protein [Candidatus Woesearchaeota archaeon]
MKIIKIPFSGGGLNHGNGANKAPDKIVSHLKNFFSNETGLIPKFEIEEIKVDESNISQSHQNIEEHLSKINEKAILLGGDHSITYPSIKAFSKNNKDFKLIIFDAHPDLMDDFIPPTQEDYLKTLIENNYVNPENILLVGIRNSDILELNYLKEKTIKFLTANDILEKGIKDITKIICNFSDKTTYLSIDIDVVDPVEAIGTGYIEHGGMSSRELIYCLQNLKKTGNLKMIDIVEVNPEKDVKDITSILATKLIVEMFDL